MSEECKSLENTAKSQEKQKPLNSIQNYTNAAECFKKYNKEKQEQNCLEKAAYIYRTLGNNENNPEKAFSHYQHSADLYKKINKLNESDKSLNEGYNRFIEISKNIMKDASNASEDFEAESLYEKASNYAIKGNNIELKNKCWIEAGNRFRSSASKIQSPFDAFNMYKFAIKNYTKGEAAELTTQTYEESADKFEKIGNTIEKSNKDLVLAIYNYNQAKILYEKVNNQKNTVSIQDKIEELCKTIGISIEFIISYLNSNQLKPIQFDFSNEQSLIDSINLSLRNN
ncbi:MAG: hypothetical protein OEY49_18025 [Candidatus Heimdallarchaeota archaeon]|nr:hypothetical protein [Candidatus Heimdallarchaeota archaeon]